MLTERDYRVVFEASPDAMLIVDAGGTIRDLNPQAVAMFGWSREEMDGSPVERLVPADPDPRIEGFIAMLFRDLIDSTNEGDDETTCSASSVGTAFKSCRVRFSGPWRKRNNVSDFVWCMENRINSGVHNDHFPGLTAPTQQSASRGSDWDADDIRSTWLQNLTDN